MGGRKDHIPSLQKSADALSPRRLMMLTALFVIAISTILVGDIQEENKARQTETALRIAATADNCANAINIAAITGNTSRQALQRCIPQGTVSLYEIADNRDIVTAFGATKKLDVTGPVIRSISLNNNGAAILSLSNGDATASWRKLDSGRVLLAVAPKHDIYSRTPPWITPTLLIIAISLVTASLMAAFIRQSGTAASAASALQKLQTLDIAFKAGRTGAWQFHCKDRVLTMSRYVLEPLGLGNRDRRFSLSELTALLHPEDLRNALAILTGDTSGIHEGEVRLRHPEFGWSRAYFRTSPNATRHSRHGIVVEMTGTNALTPTATLAESRLKDAIESISEAFVLWDSQGNLVAWNRRFASIFHLEPRELRVGISAEDVAALARVGNSIVTQYFAPEAAINEQSIEISLPKGRWLHVSRRRTSEGGLVCVASNVTDMKRRARAQQKKERELKGVISDLRSSRRDLNDTMQKYQIEKHKAEDASRSKSEFLANMSHELRTPLNAINGFSEIMASELYGPLGDQKYKEYVTDILSSGQHLLELIDDVLDMSKIEAGKLKLEPQRVELERTLNESARLVTKRAHDAGVTLNTSVAHAPAVWADARAVKQVTLNLLSNAINFTPEGGEVTLTAEADLDGVTIIVVDSGAGISPEQMTRLGAPFEMTDNNAASNNRSGSGLGLALSKSLMDLHGGLLALASQPGKGTVACATFPRRQNAKVRLPQFFRKEAHILTTGEAPEQVTKPVTATSQAAE